MGAWSTSSFGNDTACDWAYGLSDCDDLSLIEDTLENVLEVGSEYLEAPDAEEAIAAVETLARLKGNWGERDAYTEQADAWVERVKLKPGQALVEKARQVIDRILASDSELMALWEDSDEFDAWKSSIEDLKVRISA
jgi:hypothetical protein